MIARLYITRLSIDVMHSHLLSDQYAQIPSGEKLALLVESGYHFDKRARTVVVCYVDVDEQNRLIESVAHCFRNFCRASIRIREFPEGQLI